MRWSDNYEKFEEQMIKGLRNGKVTWAQLGKIAEEGDIVPTHIQNLQMLIHQGKLKVVEELEFFFKGRVNGLSANAANEMTNKWFNPFSPALKGLTQDSAPGAMVLELQMKEQQDEFAKLQEEQRQAEVADLKKQSEKKMRDHFRDANGLGH